MKLSTASSSSPKKRDSSVSGPRLRKKHKRLDAICEEEYTKNHIEPNEVDDEGDVTGSAAPNSELRRSSRVRRAPEVLDVSPPPVKKRRLKMDKNMNTDVNKRLNSKLMSAKEEESGKSVSPGVWGSRLRLRSRGRKVGLRVKSEVRERRQLFGEMGEKAVQSGVDTERESDGGDLELLEMDRLGTVKDMNDLGDNLEKSGDEEEMLEKEEMLVSSGVKKENWGEEETEVVGNEKEVDKTILETVLGVENVTEVVEGNANEVVEEEETKTLSDKELMEDCIGDNTVEVIETSDKSDKERMEFENGDEGEDHQDGGEHDEGQDRQDGGEHDEGEGHQDGGELDEGENCQDGEEHDEGDGHQDGADHYEGEDHEDGGEHVKISTIVVKDGGIDHKKDGSVATIEEKPMEFENAPQVGAFSHGSNSTLGRPRIKQGRRCGLCGCGNDGKPPKRLIQDAGESENEVYSGSSASEEPNYDLWDGFGDEPGWLGRLLGPINDRYGIAGTWVHQHCAVWSPEVCSFD